MTIPRKRTTKSAQGQRRAHLKLKEVRFSVCPNCGNLKLPHRVCKNCGYYKDREIINTLKKGKHGK